MRTLKCQNSCHTLIFHSDVMCFDLVFAKSHRPELTFMKGRYWEAVQISDGDSSADQGIYDQINQISQEDKNPSQI